MSHAAGQFGYLSDEYLIFVAPIDEGFVLVHGLIRQTILDENLPNLPDLVGFCFIPIPLNIDFLLDPRLPKYMMAALDALLEPQAQGQSPQIVKRDVGVGRALADQGYQLVPFAHKALPKMPGMRIHARLALVI
jgi:hypothetical protein